MSSLLCASGQCNAHSSCQHIAMAVQQNHAHYIPHFLHCIHSPGLHLPLRCGRLLLQQSPAASLCQRQHRLCPPRPNSPAMRRAPTSHAAYARTAVRGRARQPCIAQRTYAQEQHWNWAHDMVYLHLECHRLTDQHTRIADTSRWEEVGRGVTLNAMRATSIQPHAMRAMTVQSQYTHSNST